MPLQHTALDPARSEIQTLTLLPGQYDDTIHCILQIVSLDDDPEYEALSYVWGRDRDSKEIFFDEQACTITVNLDAALRRLLDETEPRVLWVDALCINQNDIVEKNVQVPIMGRVNCGASRVIAWLGE
ncbi:hypothetical protein BU23DRAFT_374876, partial [Bimuria novae-zelandiae CBS 107.79]